MNKNINIPNGWHKTTLNKLGLFSKGKAISKLELTDKGINCLRYAEIYTKYNFEVKNIKSFISESSTKNSLKLKKGDIIFAGSGEKMEEIGKSICFNIDSPTYVGGDTIILSTRNQTANSKFLSFFLNTVSREQLNKLGTGYSVVHIYKKDLEHLSVVIPNDIKEQEGIAEVLESWDQMIELLTKKVQLLQTRKKALMQKLLTPQRHWESKTLNKLFTIKKGTQLNKLHMIEEGEYKVFNGGVDISGYTDTYNTPANTIIISEGGNSCGYVNFVKSNFWAGGHCYRVLDLKENISFTYYLLKNHESYIQKLRVGSGLPNIQKKDIDSYKVSIPPLPEQQQIAEVLTEADEGIKLVQQQLENYKLQKKALMQKLLTGVWRLPEYRN